MADRLYRVQVSIPLDSAIPDDAIVNTFHFDDDDDPLAGAEDTQGWIMDALTTFYNRIDQTLFPNTVGPAATVKMYDLRDPEPRVLRFQDTIALTPAASDPLPNEVALCISFAATPVAGVNPQRRRGRLFIGPIAQSAGVVVASQLRPTSSAMAELAGAGSDLIDGISHPASPGLHLKWSIYSPTTDAAGASIDDSFNDVVSGWVDNAFDTQRRRGPAATTRTTFS